MSNRFNKRIAVKVAAPEDMRKLAPNLRQADIAEVAAATGQTGLEALLEGLALTPFCLYATYDDAPMAAFGIVPDKENPELGVPWLLGSDLIAKCPVTFLRYSRNWLRTLGADYEVLANYVKADHAESINYLKHLGFSFGEPVQMGPQDEIFIPFSKIVNEGE